MVVNWPEVALIVALNAAILAGVLALFLKVGAPRLLSKAEIWMGGAIGRFWQELMKKAAEEEGSEGSSPGALSLGGFKIDAGTIQSITQLLKMAQEMGFIKSGSGGGGGW